MEKVILNLFKILFSQKVGVHFIEKSALCCNRYSHGAIKQKKMRTSIGPSGKHKLTCLQQTSASSLNRPKRQTNIYVEKMQEQKHKNVQLKQLLIATVPPYLTIGQRVQNKWAQTKAKDKKPNCLLQIEDTKFGVNEPLREHGLD